MLKQLVVRQLRRLAKRQLTAFTPTVVAVTGSVGKTSTKNAIAIALAAKHSVRKSEKNYNNEFGVPLAILAETSPGKNLWEWIKLFRRARHIKTFPKYLVLEYGADKPGDIAELCKLARPDIGVITAISPVHAVNYPNLAALADEKATLGDFVPEHGLVILNSDDATVALMKDRFSAPVITYGKEDA
ncbi:MAG: Mur ligase family protein, partial [Candidatus Uhrbacteria bacterium]|nr:Mur ligase family protein [Candidatus Uhrbacteria bacterium]